jgi:hypothetical protein
MKPIDERKSMLMASMLDTPTGNIATGRCSGPLTSLTCAASPRDPMSMKLTPRPPATRKSTRGARPGAI